MVCIFAVIRIVLICGLLHIILKPHCRAEKGVLTNQDVSHEHELSAIGNVEHVPIQIIDEPVITVSTLTVDSLPQEIIFKKGTVYQRKLKIESIGPGNGIGWIKAFYSAAKSCDPLKENWLYLKYMYAQNANRVYMTIDYQSSTTCDKFGCGLFIRLHKSKRAPFAVKKEDFQDGISGLNANQNRKVTVVHFDMEPDKKFLTFAIQAKDVCTVVYHISVYYYYCPKNNSTSVTLTRMPAPISGSTAVDVRCPQQSSSKERSMVAYCTSNGTWENFSPQSNLCRCPAGKELNNKTHDCSPCEKNYFKSAETNTCKPCPKNMISKKLGAIKCECTPNFYRNSEDQICRKLPSKPVKLHYSILKDNKIRLFWETPLNFGDQKDLHFKVKCQQCKEPLTNCKFCENMSIDEEGIKLSATNLTVSHLQVNTHYEFSVTSLNGVSSDANKNDWQSSKIVVKISGKNVHTSILPGLPISSITGKKVHPSILPGPPISSTTGTNGRENGDQTEESINSKFIAIIVTSVLLGIILICVFILLFIKKQRRSKKDSSSMLNVEQIELQSANADQSTMSSEVPGSKITTLFRNIEHAVECSWEFPKERLLNISTLGSGNFGMVKKALALAFRSNSDHNHIPVAVKLLKEKVTEKDRNDFLTELSLMKEMEPHPYIVQFLGCSTESEPVLMILEYLAGGDLLGFLRKSRGHEDSYNTGHFRPNSRLGEKQLLSFAWMVSEAMTFLSRNKIVHRDLAARNVLVSEDNICKLSDFGLAREGNYNRKSQARLPVKWMAPEDIFTRQSTSMSDVWSYGILLWEILTIGGSPYPGMNGEKVINCIQSGYRMPKLPHCSKELYNLMRSCWNENPDDRPEFSTISSFFLELLNNWRIYLDLSEYVEASYMDV